MGPLLPTGAFSQEHNDTEPPPPASQTLKRMLREGRAQHHELMPKVEKGDPVLAVPITAISGGQHINLLFCPPDRG